MGKIWYQMGELIEMKGLCNTHTDTNCDGWHENGCHRVTYLNAQSAWGETILKDF